MVSINNIVKKNLKNFIVFKYIFFMSFSENTLKIDDFLIQNSKSYLSNEKNLYLISKNSDEKKEEKKYFRKLFYVSDHIVSNMIINIHYIYLIVEKNYKYFLCKKNLMNEEISYYQLKNINFKKNLRFKIANQNNNLFIIDEEGKIYLYINNELIIINEKLLIPIYDIPILRIKDNDLLIYLFHGPDIVSEIIIKNYLNFKIQKDIIYKIIHQAEEFNNKYINFNNENTLLIDDYLIISAKNSYLYIYKNNDLLWYKSLNGNYHSFIQHIYFNNNNYIYTFNFYNGEVNLFDLNTGAKIWNYIHEESIINSYYIEEVESFILLDYKFNLLILNKQGEKKFIVNILKSFTKKKLFQKVYNFFIIKSQVILLTDKGIYIFYSNLEKYIYIPMIVDSKNLLLYNNEYLFFNYENKVYVI